MFVCLTIILLKTNHFNTVFSALRFEVRSFYFTYDALGNPTSYRGKSLTWERGRLLKSYGNTYFSYYSDGKRRGVGGVSLAEDSEGRGVRSAGQLKPGDRLRLRFADGGADCTVDSVTTKGE